MTANLRIDGERLWDSLMEMARIGATARGGVCRVALTELDREGRELFRRWCEAAGCELRVDAMGNLFARRAGTDAEALPVATGSHLDSQPTGGKFDGAYGVLAGLEVLRTLNDHGVRTRAPLEVVVWTNEEGARFAPAMIGSGVYAGAFELDYAYGQTDHDGVRLLDALEAIGYRGELAPGHQRYAAFFEAHIEQGPILEAQGLTIGVVSGVQGIRWYDVQVIGAEAHSGPTPMERRADALLAASELVMAVNRIARDQAPHGRGTVGELHVSPGSRNTVPGRVDLTIDLRHPQIETLHAMDSALEAAATALAASHGVRIALQCIWESAPVAFDAQCVAAIRKGADAIGCESLEMVSGAGHDAVYMSRVAPTAMVFVPCENGISHNEVENATAADLGAGANVLLHAMLERAGVAA